MLILCSKHMHYIVSYLTFSYLTFNDLPFLINKTGLHVNWFTVAESTRPLSVTLIWPEPDPSLCIPTLKRFTDWCQSEIANPRSLTLP